MYYHCMNTYMYCNTKFSFLKKKKFHHSCCHHASPLSLSLFLSLSLSPYFTGRKDTF